MNKKEKARFIEKKLNEYFPHPKIFLLHKDPYTLLIAVLLSAQSTDAMVNKITPLLFRKADTPKKMIATGEEKIKKIIRPCGLYRKKAKAIVSLSKKLLEQFKGKVPKEIKKLETLPGIGHKSASVVVSQAFNIPSFPVDTHIHRLAKRWKLTNGKNEKQTEKDLKRIFPKNKWGKIHLQMIAFGRKFCKAQSHKKEKCPICKSLG